MYLFIFMKWCVFGCMLSDELMWAGGVVPDIIFGYSMGEMASSYCSGSLSLEDTIFVCWTRAKAQFSVKKKEFIAAGGTNYGKLCGINQGYDRMDVTGHNSPTMCNFSGDWDALKDVLADRDAQGIWCRKLAVDEAMHSYQVEGMRKTIFNSLTNIHPLQRVFPVISTY
jgi:acyl transferase domain-containing protein